MKQSIEIKGTWWFSEFESDQVSGVLTFSQETGAVLEVFEAFPSLVSYNESENEVILGITVDGRQVSLHGCSTAFGLSKIWIQRVFVGAHFKQLKDARFTKLHGCYTDLDSWVDTSGFEFGYKRADANHFEVNLSYQRPRGHLFDIGDGFRVGVNFSSYVHGPTLVPREVRISQEAYLVAEHFSSDVLFEELFDRMMRMVYLQQMGVQRLTYPLKLTGYTKQNAQLQIDGQAYYPEVEIFYQPIESIKHRDDVHHHDMLFGFRDLEEKHILNWCNSFPKLKTMLHLYRSLLYTERMFVDTKFLHIVQALESLHDLLLTGYRFDDNEFQHRKSKVLSLIEAPELRDWVEKALGRANYKSLGERITELIKGKQELFSNVVTDVELFVALVVKTRNKLTHPSNKKNKTFSFGDELTGATRLLTYLFEAYMLDEIGFPEPKIAEIYKRHTSRFLGRWSPF